MSKHSRVLILGAGPAGYTAAIYAARSMLEPRLIAGGQPGGQLTITTEVENYPGFEHPILGPELMDRMASQAVNMGAIVESDTITSVDLSRRPFTLKGDSGQIYTTDSLIIATGAHARWLGLPSEEHFKGYGVSACATCDGFFFRGKKVVVVGGGNTAVEEALFLTRFAEEVVIVHRRDTFRAEQIMQAKVFANPKIRIRWSCEVAAILGKEGPRCVTGVELLDRQTGAVERLEVDGVFVAIGHDPATQLFAGQLPMADGGYLIPKAGRTETAIPGVFVAGDVADNLYRQAVTAAGTGAMAALDAERHLTALDENAAA